MDRIDDDDKAAVDDFEPALTVGLRGGYSFGQIERLIANLQPLFAVTDPVDISIDLTGLIFIGPTATALLLATANRLGDLGCRVRIWPPNNRLTYNYLTRPGHGSRTGGPQSSVLSADGLAASMVRLQ